MNEAALIAVIFLAGALLGFFKTAEGAIKSGNFDALYKKHGRLTGVDWRLIKAIAMVESNERGGVKNPNEPSYGLMQLYCVADCQGCRCTNVKNIQGWDQATPDRLLNDPDFNVSMGAQVIDWHIRTYGLKKGIATYNCWSCRSQPPDGPFANQAYVDKVLQNYRTLQAVTDTRAPRQTA